jgi:hypothetical protein
MSLKEKISLYLFKKKVKKLSSYLGLKVKYLQVFNLSTINIRYYDNKGYLQNYIIKKDR